MEYRASHTLLPRRPSSQVPILTDYELLGTHAYAVYPKTRYITQRTMCLVDFFGEMPYWDKMT